MMLNQRRSKAFGLIASLSLCLAASCDEQPIGGPPPFTDQFVAVSRYVLPSRYAIATPTAANVDVQEKSVSNDFRLKDMACIGSRMFACGPIGIYSINVQAGKATLVWEPEGGREISRSMAVVQAKIFVIVDGSIWEFDPARNEARNTGFTARTISEIRSDGEIVVFVDADGFLCSWNLAQGLAPTRARASGDKLVFVRGVIGGVAVCSIGGSYEAVDMTGQNKGKVVQIQAAMDQSRGSIKGVLRLSGEDWIVCSPEVWGDSRTELVRVSDLLRYVVIGMDYANGTVMCIPSNSDAQGKAPYEFE